MVGGVGCKTQLLDRSSWDRVRYAGFTQTFRADFRWCNAMNRFLHRIALTAVLTSTVGTAACQFLSAHPAAQQSRDQTASSDPEQPENPLTIQNDSQLPDTYPHVNYLIHLIASGGVSPLHWRVEKGALPPGIKLDDSGLLHGEAEHGGEFQFTVSVTDSGSPRQAVQKQFLIRVRSALSVNWKSPARVNGNRIDGSVEVSNSSPDNMDLTFYVLAVASLDGRATAIGYQHFPLRRGVTDMELPFGDTLPSGGYVVHVDVVGEVAAKNLIYREHMQTPGPLHVTVGP